MKRFIEQENVYKLDSWPLQKKSTTPYRQILRSESGGGSYCVPTVKKIKIIILERFQVEKNYMNIFVGFENM